MKQLLWSRSKAGRACYKLLLARSSADLQTPFGKELEWLGKLLLARSWAWQTPFGKELGLAWCLATKSFWQGVRPAKGAANSFWQGVGVAWHSFWQGVPLLARGGGTSPFSKGFCCSCNQAETARRRSSSTAAAKVLYTWCPLFTNQSCFSNLVVIGTQWPTLFFKHHSQGQKGPE